MMSEGFDLYTLVFLGLAVFIFFRLRSVLGQRTGHERPPVETRRRDLPPLAPGADKVVPMPSRSETPAADDEPAVYRWQGIATEGTPLAEGLDAIAAVDPSMDPARFSAGAKAAYEMIVNAFNSGDRKALKPLLSREVYDSFVQAITEREGRGETIEAKFVSLDKAEIVGAALKGKTAQLTVRFVSQMISATKDKTGSIIDGSAEKMTEVIDQWTFARETNTSDPNWRLVATDEA